MAIDQWRCSCLCSADSAQLKEEKSFAYCLQDPRELFEKRATPQHAILIQDFLSHHPSSLTADETRLFQSFCEVAKRHMEEVDCLNWRNSLAYWESEGFLELRSVVRKGKRRAVASLRVRCYFRILSNATFVNVISLDLCADSH